MKDELAGPASVKAGPRVTAERARRLPRASGVQGIVRAAYVGTAVLAFFTVRESQSGMPPFGLLPVLALFVAGLGSFVVRQRFPHGALAYCLALMLVSFAVGTGAEVVLVLVALVTEGVTASARRAWLGFGATAAVALPAAAVLAVRFQAMDSLAVTGEWNFSTPRFGQDFWNILLIGVMLCLVATLIGINSGHRRRLVDSLRERAQQMERERDQQARIATAKERERIAREMHDVIAHSLSVMIAVSDGAHAIALLRPEESRIAMGRVAETGRKTLGEVRRLLGTVRGDATDDGVHVPQPGMDQVHELADEFRGAGLPVVLSVSGVLPDDPALGLTIYRIMQESLTNVLRHARAVREVRVDIAASAHEITIVVEDSAAAPASQSANGRGLVGISERAAIYDGDVESGPRAGGGWRVFVRLAIGENDE